MAMKFPRLAVRALIVEDGRLLLVNAYPGGRSDLWCAPGGGVMAGQDLPGNLAREVREETGLTIAAGALVGVNEFHDPDNGFHQIDLFFRATVTAGRIGADWTDPEGVVTERQFFTRVQMGLIRYKPDSLPAFAFDVAGGAHYDPLERIVT